MLNFISIKLSDSFGRTDGKSFDAVRVPSVIFFTDNFYIRVL